MRVITVREIESRIIILNRDIKNEKNAKERLRLVDEQAALKLVRRTLPQYEATLIGKRIAAGS